MVFAKTTIEQLNTLGVTRMNLVNQSVIKHKMGLLNLAEELQNISQACRVMSVSHDTLVWLVALSPGSVDAAAP